MLYFWQHILQGDTYDDNVWAKRDKFRTMEYKVPLQA